MPHVVFQTIGVFDAMFCFRFLNPSSTGENPCCVPSLSSIRSLTPSPRSSQENQILGPDGNFGKVLELAGDYVLCLFDPPCKRLKVNKPLSLTQPQLERLNNESIRLGLRANLWENMVAALPRERFKIVEVFQHVNGKGHRNIRLGLLIGPHKDDLLHVLLDVTADAWAEIQKGR